MRSSVEDLRTIAAEESFSVAAIEARAGSLADLASSFSPDEFRRMVVIWREEKEGGSRPLYPSGVGPRVRRSPDPVQAGDLLRSEDPPDEEMAAASSDRIVPSSMRGRSVSGPPPGWRARANRRWYPGQVAAPFWIWGTSFQQVRAWLAFGHKSTDATERELVRRLVQLVRDPAGGIDRGARWREWSAELALAFALWFAQATTARRGYHGAVVGVPRGLLAQWSAQRARGVSVHVDTVSRILGRLRPVVGDLIQWHQPSPRQASRFGLPRSLHYMPSGRVACQAINVYWFRRVEEKTVPGAGLSSRSSVSDLASGYQKHCRKIGSPASYQEKECGPSGLTHPPGVPPGSS